MTAPQWYSQPFRPDGSISAEGLRNQLGRPSLSLLTVLVRESAQNAWDARTQDLVDFHVELGLVGASRLPAWRDLLGHAMPVAPADDFPLRAAVRRPSLRYLAVSDRGTAGLGGPTRSDHATAAGVNRNWLAFVLNSGDKTDGDGGGGTYGYGKGVFFLASRCGTVLVHTRFRDESGRLRTRLIGSTLMRSYTIRDTPYTGRHWWGRPTGDYCEPLTDTDADQVAARLGLPDFVDDATGTSIVVVDPDLTDPTLPDDQEEEMTLLDAGQKIADASAWNLWPLTLPERNTRMVVRVTADGADIPVPGESDPLLRSFADAYRAATAPNAEVALCKRPVRELGTLAHVNTFAAYAATFAARELGLEGAPHHFALMRRPDLVVSYFRGPAKLSPDAGYAGVLKVADDLNDVFAEAEPPTHDAWVDTQLKGRSASFVRVTHTRLKEKCLEIAGARISAAEAKAISVGSVSQRLGHLMSGPGATGAALGQGRVLTGPAGAPPDDPSGTGADNHVGSHRALEADEAARARPQPRRPQLIGDPSYEIVWDRYVVRQRVSVPGPGVFRGVCHVVTGDGVHEIDSPAGAQQPTVLGWRVGTAIRRGETVALTEAGLVDLLVEPAADAAFDISVEAGK